MPPSQFRNRHKTESASRHSGSQVAIHSDGTDLSDRFQSSEVPGSSQIQRIQFCQDREGACPIERLFVQVPISGLPGIQRETGTTLSACAKALSSLTTFSLKHGPSIQFFAVLSLTTTKENVCQRPEEPMSKSLPSLATGHSRHVWMHLTVP